MADSSLDALLAALRRAPAQAARTRAAVESALGAAVAELLRGAFTRPQQQAAYRIDDLAQAAGTTVRNVRAYQERGLLHPPQRVGRVAVFDDSHLARLRLITSMLDRGYTTAQITELLATWESGGDLSDVLGLERLIRPWAGDRPTRMTLGEVRALAGDQQALDRLVADGLVEISGRRVVVQRPRLLRAFAEMRAHGMPMQTVIALHERLVPLLEEVSRALVEAGAAHVATRLPAEPDEAAINDLVADVVRYRTLASDSVTATLEHALERRMEAVLTDYLAAHLSSLAGAPPVAEDAG